MPRETDLNNLDQLLANHFDRLFGYVSLRLSPDNATVEDIVQTTFIDAWNKRSQFRGDCSVYTWLSTIARNKVNDHLRSTDTKRRAYANWTDQRRETLTGTNDTEAKAHAVQQALNALSDRHAELLEAKYLDGMSVKAIAEAQKQSPKTIESALTRARQAFSQAYQQQHQEDLP